MELVNRYSPEQLAEIKEHAEFSFLALLEIAFGVMEAGEDQDEVLSIAWEVEESFKDMFGEEFSFTTDE